MPKSGVNFIEVPGFPNKRIGGVITKQEREEAISRTENIFVPEEHRKAEKEAKAYAQRTKRTMGYYLTEEEKAAIKRGEVFYDVPVFEMASEAASRTITETPGEVVDAIGTGLSLENAHARALIQSMATEQFGADPSFDLSPLAANKSICLTIVVKNFSIPISQKV